MMSNAYVTREDRVNEFVSKTKGLEEKTSWVCFDEEVAELYEAGMDYIKEPSEETRAAFVKELADVQYTLSQLALFYDVNMQVAFNRVADNNMTKVVDGEVRYREDGKVLKPDNYVKPDMSGL